MKCRLCECDLTDKAHFMVGIVMPNKMAREIRGPFCNSERCMLMIRGQVDQLNGIGEHVLALNTG
jgi:hypothetical protein